MRPLDQASSSTLLVAGGAGFIGSCFVHQAVARGHRVIVLDALTYAGHRENLDDLAGPGSMELVVGNICDRDLVHRLMVSNGVDAVVNFAAESHVDRSISAPSAFIETNVVGTFTLLDASHRYWLTQHAERKDRFRYLHVSTDEVYGSLGPVGKFNENSPYAPNSPYSASKASGDHLVRAWFHTYGLPTVTTNCSNNYGPRQYPEKLIPYMIKCALAGKPLPVYGDGGNVRDWIHVEDHCEGIFLALQKADAGSIYCFGGDSERNNLDVVRTICRHLDVLRPRPDNQKHESAIVFVTDRLGHDWRYAIDDERAQLELGFRRNYDFDGGLANTVSWYLDHAAWMEQVTRERTDG